MKYLLIFSILCIAGVQSARTRFSPRSISEQKEKYIEECAKELDMPVFKTDVAYILIERIAFFYPGPKSDKTICMTTCIARKKSELHGLKLHERILKDIDFLYYFGMGSPKVTREELKSRVNYCHAKESNECEFYKCLDVMKPPFASLSASLLKPLILAQIRNKFQ